MSKTLQVLCEDLLVELGLAPVLDDGGALLDTNELETVKAFAHKIRKAALKDACKALKRLKRTTSQPTKKKK